MSQAYISSGGMQMLDLRDVVRNEGYIQSAWVINGAWELTGDSHGYWPVDRPGSVTPWGAVEVHDDDRNL